MHKDHKFVGHIPNLFFKAIKTLIQAIRTTCWIQIRKGQLHGRELTIEQVANKPHLDHFLRSNLVIMI
jgi:hypothetical protein